MPSVMSPFQPAWLQSSEAFSDKHKSLRQEVRKGLVMKTTHDPHVGVIV